MTREATDLDSHSLQVIQAVPQSYYISSVPQLCLIRVLFKDRPIRIIICWISIDPSVQHERIEGKPPIVG